MFSDNVWQDECEDSDGEEGEAMNEGSTVKAPDVDVQLTGRDGNAFAVLGAVNKALKEAGHADLARQFMAEAMSGDYAHMLTTAMEYVNVY